jgi:hypothetical protein
MPSILFRQIQPLQFPPIREYESRLIKINRDVFCIYSDGAVWDIGQSRWRVPDIDKWGYRTLSLGGQTCKLHRLMLMIFNRAPAYGEQSRHLDGNPSNNQIENLKWGSGKQNWVDRRAHGREGAEWRCLLTNEQALAVYQDPRPENDIAKEYGVQRICVILIKEKRTYKEIHDEPV